MIDFVTRLFIFQACLVAVYNNSLSPKTVDFSGIYLFLQPYDLTNLFFPVRNDLIVSA